MNEKTRCEGCGTPLGAWEAHWRVCMDCTKARARAAFGGRCRCGRKRRERLVGARFRSWVACDRCLGAVRNVS